MEVGVSGTKRNTRPANQNSHAGASVTLVLRMVENANKAGAITIRYGAISALPEKGEVFWGYLNFKYKILRRNKYIHSYPYKGIHPLT